MFCSKIITIKPLPSYEVSRRVLLQDDLKEISEYRGNDKTCKIEAYSFKVLFNMFS